VDALQGTNDTNSGLNVQINVGGDPKQNDNIYINLSQNNDQSVKQGVQDSITQYLKYEGLSDTAAKAQSSQLTDFIFSAADKLDPSASAATAASAPTVAATTASTKSATSASS
jgi:hypothetical protein